MCALKHCTVFNGAPQYRGRPQNEHTNSVPLKENLMVANLGRPEMAPTVPARIPKVGLRVGFFVGCRVGFSVGCRVGFSVGCWVVGISVGDAVGATVVGAEDDELVGSLVGTAVGATESIATQTQVSSSSDDDNDAAEPFMVVALLPAC